MSENKFSPLDKKTFEKNKTNILFDNYNDQNEFLKNKTIDLLNIVVDDIDASESKPKDDLTSFLDRVSLDQKKVVQLEKKENAGDDVIPPFDYQKLNDFNLDCFIRPDLRVDDFTCMTRQEKDYFKEFSTPKLSKNEILNEYNKILPDDYLTNVDQHIPDNIKIELIDEFKNNLQPDEKNKIIDKVKALSDNYSNENNFQKYLSPSDIEYSELLNKTPLNNFEDKNNLNQEKQNVSVRSFESIIDNYEKPIIGNYEKNQNELINNNDLSNEDNNISGNKIDLINNDSNNKIDLINLNQNIFSRENDLIKNNDINNNVVDQNKVNLFLNSSISEPLVINDNVNNSQNNKTNTNSEGINFIDLSNQNIENSLSSNNNQVDDVKKLNINELYSNLIEKTSKENLMKSNLLDNDQINTLNNNQSNSIDTISENYKNSSLNVSVNNGSTTNSTNKDLDYNQVNNMKNDLNNKTIDNLNTAIMDKKQINKKKEIFFGQEELDLDSNQILNNSVTFDDKDIDDLLNEKSLFKYDKQLEIKKQEELKRIEEQKQYNLEIEDIIIDSNNVDNVKEEKPDLSKFNENKDSFFLKEKIWNPVFVANEMPNDQKLFKFQRQVDNDFSNIKTTVKPIGNEMLNKDIEEIKNWDQNIEHQGWDDDFKVDDIQAKKASFFNKFSFKSIKNNFENEDLSTKKEASNPIFESNVVSKDSPKFNQEVMEILKNDSKI